MRVPVSMADSLTLGNSGISGAVATQVGADPVWEDESDATYVELDGSYHGPAEPQFFAEARNAVTADQDFSDLPASLDRVTLKIDARVSGVEAGLPFPQMRLNLSGTGTSLTPVSAPAVIAQTPTWYTITMGGGIEDLRSHPDHYHLRTQAAGLADPPGASDDGQIRSWRIHEIRIYFEVKTSLAPPCRQFPGGIQGTVGGAVRQWPPPKYRQTGGRRAGGTY